MSGGRAILVVAMVLGVVACTPDGGEPDGTSAPDHTVILSVSSELGGPVPGAELVLVGQDPQPIDRSLSVELDQPVAGLVRADGYLDEPVVLDPGQGLAAVRLLRRVGPSGIERRVLHFGGDVMMGRRYQTPGGRPGTPTVDSSASARAVVGEIGPLMAAADATMVNLETVVGDLPPEGAATGKRYQIQSPPVIVDALGALGVDVAALGNNHAYDWEDDGVRSTIQALDAAGIAWAGAGASAEEAAAGRLLSVLGTPVGVVSMTTVDGDFVNDSLPTGLDPEPAQVDPNDAWQREERTFGFGAPGDPAFVPEAARLPGDAWSTFEALEPELAPAESAALWSALTSPGAYPELQDWVARRGHGGAAPFAAATVAREVATLRQQGAALVVAQIHGGFQFADVPSSFMRQAARAAVDGGADLVVAHHPHVLQGFEWYHGSLIAYSLGNLVFDQDFLSTFPSVILRTVFEGDQLVEARVVPLTIDRYRPVAVAGAAADRVLRMLSARSAAPASSERVRSDLVVDVVDTEVDGGATVTMDGTTGRVVPVAGGPEEPVELEDGHADLPPCSLVRRTGPVEASDARVGVDLLGWGAFEDSTADRSDQPTTHWTADSRAVVRYEEGRGGYLRLRPSSTDRSSARQVARSAVPEHRWYGPDGTAVDGPATYTAELVLRRRGPAPQLVLTLYDVRDTDPTVDPTSVELHTATVDLPTEATEEWQTVSVDLTDLIQDDYGGVRAEAALLYVVAPARGSDVDIDDVRLVEWRPVSGIPEGAWVEADSVESAPGSVVPLIRRDCS